MRINTNIMALNAQNKLTGNQGKVEGSIKKLSSGLRINGAADDASGLAISEKMRSQIRGLNQAQSNAQDGISMLQTAEGALQQTTDILQRMRELVVKAQNTGVLTSNDQTSITTELTALKDEVDRIANSTTFNTKKLLNGDMGTQLNTTTLGSNCKVNVANAKEGITYSIAATSSKITLSWTDGTAKTEEVAVPQTINGVIKFANAGIEIDVGTTDVAATSINGKNIVTKAASAAGGKEKAAFKIGANTYDEDQLFVGIGDMRSAALGVTIDISTTANADAALKNLDNAINKVSSQRASLGAVQNRMEYAVENLSTTSENLTAAESRIRDVDMAAEMVTYTKNSILNQSAMAMLAQANQQPQQILSLLG
ncbi:MAG: flagellin [Clostridia bacterium]|nr:flagellin [Clostridia bacterium]